MIEAYAEDVSFFVPEVAFAEAEEHLPALVIKRGNDPAKALAFLHTLGHLVEVIGSDVYGEFEAEARERLGQRDPEDWPILAAALALGCPSGQRIPIFSNAGSPRGPPAACKCFCAAVRSSRECRGSESGRRQVGPADRRLGSRQSWSRPSKRGGLRS